MIVVADTGSINYLILIEEIEALGSLYERVLIPPSVDEELDHERAPEAVRRWIAAPPFWLEVRTPNRADDEDLTHLDAGEREAILLAEELHADLIIIDESRGRQEAKRRHLPFTGTLGVLQVAAHRGLLDLKRAIDRLRQTSFHASQEILDQLLKGEL